MEYSARVRPRRALPPEIRRGEVGEGRVPVTKVLLGLLFIFLVYEGFAWVNARIVQQKAHSNYDDLRVGMSISSISIPWKGDDDAAGGISCKNYAGDVTFHIKP